MALYDFQVQIEGLKGRDGGFSNYLISTHWSWTTAKSLPLLWRKQEKGQKQRNEREHKESGRWEE